MRKDILSFCEQHGSLPREIRANPLTVVELPCSQWMAFQLNIQDRLIEVPIRTDVEIPLGQFCYIPKDEPKTSNAFEHQSTIAMEAVRVEG